MHTLIMILIIPIVSRTLKVITTTVNSVPRDANAHKLGKTTVTFTFIIISMKPPVIFRSLNRATWMPNADITDGLCSTHCMCHSAVLLGFRGTSQLFAGDVMNLFVVPDTNLSGVGGNTPLSRTVCRRSQSRRNSLIISEHQASLWHSPTAAVH